MLANPYLIAIVENDASHGCAVAPLLRDARLGGQTFASAEESVASDAPELRRCPILDIQLPGMSGFALLDHSKNLAPQRPANFITRRDDDEVQKHASRFPGN